MTVPPHTLTAMPSVDQDTDAAPPASPALSADEARKALANRILHVAWMSIVLAIVIQAVLVILQVFFSRAIEANPLIADLAGKFTWSVLVCSAIAAGTAATRARPAVMGIVGLLAAPAAFAAARAIQKALSAQLNVPAGPPPIPTPLAMSIIRAVEYGIFGVLIGWMSGKPWGGLGAHAAAGLALGLSVAGVVLTITVTNSPAAPSAFVLVAKGLSEALFPLGCAMVVYLAGLLGSRTLGSG